MRDTLLLLLSTVLVNNFVLVKFLGLCPLMGVSKKPETALGMGAATTFVLTTASVVTYLLERYLLQPFGLTRKRQASTVLTIEKSGSCSRAGAL